MKYYTPTHIAEATGLTVRTVRNYLLERFPWHEPETWWRLELSEYESVIEELKGAQKISACHPRRALRRSESRLVSPRRARAYAR